jgi:anti-anti-sigma factor
MEYNISQDGKWVVISVNGPITFETSDDLQAGFDQVLSDGAKFVRLNLSLVPVSSSSGISSILVLYRKLKKRDGILEIKGISENLFAMFKLLKIDKLIKISEE